MLKIIKFFLISSIIAIFTVFVFIKFSKKIINNLQDIHQLENYMPNLSTKIYDKNNNLIAEVFNEKRSFVPINEIPDILQKAFISIEDNNFFEHWGISIKSTIRALIKILLTWKISEGGSTISQQLTKTIFLNREKTLIRKIKEAFLTIQLEKNYSKNEILQLYMNQIYFGNGAYGVQAAAKTYFDKNVQDLSISECATIAAIPKSPNYYNPLKNISVSTKRRNLVLSKMKRFGYITNKQKKNALKENIKIIKTNNSISHENGLYFIEFIKIMLENKYGTDIMKSGISIYTTLDIKAQKAAEKIVEETLSKFDENMKQTFFEKRKKTFTKVQCALIAIDPVDGAIRAMIGGRDFKESQFNRATQAKRQAGSIFKPLLYLSAIEHGLTPATILNDEPMIFLYNGKTWDLFSRNIIDLETLAEIIPEKNLIDTKKIWTPKNYSNKYNGKIALGAALALSINTCAIETIIKITPKNVIETAKKLGLTTDMTDSFSLALGSNDIILQEIVSAFSVFASGGIKSKPYAIIKITDRNNKIIEQEIPEQNEILSQQVSFIITNMLKNTVEKGTAKCAKNLGRPCAAKTGTTNKSNDVWFVGYTPQIVAGVWVGYDNKSINLGDRVTGSSLACPIWTSFMKETLNEEKILNFIEPDEIELALVSSKIKSKLSNNDNTLLLLEAFKYGTIPKSNNIVLRDNINFYNS
jgi:penicillin-binding protein 1A